MKQNSGCKFISLSLAFFTTPPLAIFGAIAAALGLVHYAETGLLGVVLPAIAAIIGALGFMAVISEMEKMEI